MKNSIIRFLGPPLGENRRWGSRLWPTREIAVYMERDMGWESASSYDFHAKSELHFKKLSQSLVKKKLLPNRYHPPNLGDSPRWQKGALWNATEVSYKLRYAHVRTILRDKSDRLLSVDDSCFIGKSIFHGIVWAPITPHIENRAQYREIYVSSRNCQSDAVCRGYETNYLCRDQSFVKFFQIAMYFGINKLVLWNYLLKMSKKFI